MLLDAMMFLKTRRNVALLWNTVLTEIYQTTSLREDGFQRQLLWKQQIKLLRDIHILFLRMPFTETLNLPTLLKGKIIGKSQILGFPLDQIPKLNQNITLGLPSICLQSLLSKTFTQLKQTYFQSEFYCMSSQLVVLHGNQGQKRI